MEYLELLNRGVRAIHSLYSSYTSRNGRKGGKGRMSNPKDVAGGHIEELFTLALSGGTATLVLSDLNNASILIEMGRIFRNYRYRKVKLVFYPNTYSTAQSIGFMYSSGAYGTAPATIFECEGEYVNMMTNGQTVTSSLEIPHTALNPTHSWFTTTGDASESSSEIIGNIFFRSAVSSTETLFLKLEIDYEFCNPLDPTVITPQILSLERRIYERDLKLLEQQEIGTSKEKKSSDGLDVNRLEKGCCELDTVADEKPAFCSKCGFKLTDEAICLSCRDKTRTSKFNSGFC